MERKYELKFIQECALRYLHDGDMEALEFRYNKSTGAVSALLNVDAEIANETICEGILKFTKDDFARSEIIGGDPNWFGDIYGLEGFRGHNWYIKVYIEDNLVIMSFHPTTKPLTLADGRTLQVTNS